MYMHVPVCYTVPLQIRARASSTSHLCLKEDVADSRMLMNISLKNTWIQEWGNGEWENEVWEQFKKWDIEV